MDTTGEAGKYPTLRQQDLHIIAVGSAPREGENAADELLRQLITLPRPVRVEFAKTATATTAAASLLPPSSPTGSLENDQAWQKKGLETVPPLPARDAHSGAETEQNDNEGEERKDQRGGYMAAEPPLGEDAGHREAGPALGESLSSTGGDEPPQGESAGHHDEERDLVTGDDGEESDRGASPRPPPHRHGTLPSAGWQGDRVDVVGVGDHDGDNTGQRQQGEGGQDGGQNRAENERREQPDLHDNEGLLAAGEEKHGHAPRRPQRHGTLPEGIDWEENLHSGRGGNVDPRATTAAAAPSIGDEESEETSWSMAEEANFRSSPANRSLSPTRSSHGPNARRSHLVLTPEGSESSAWSNGRVNADGVDSIQRWLQVSGCPLARVRDRFRR